MSLPHYGAQGCRVLQITPTDMVNGVVIDPAPADFNPRPSTNPGTTDTAAGWPYELDAAVLDHFSPATGFFLRSPDFLHASPSMSKE